MTRNLRLVTLIAVAIALDATLLVMPPGRAILDARLHWNAADATALLSALGVTGRAGYVRHELVDLGFIATYTLLGHELARRFQSPALRIAVLVTAAFDVVETLGIVALLRAYPADLAALATVLGWSTSLKWLATAIAVVVGLRARLVGQR